MTGLPTLALDDLVARIPDGALIALPADYSGVAVAATRALLARGIRDLRLFACPTSGLQADLLIRAGAVAVMEAAAVTLGEFGQAPAFVAAVREGRIAMRDSTCPAVHAALAAAEKGVPFMPLRGVLGTDVLRHRADWRVIQNPFAEGEDPILLIPAVRPDIALFHARAADREGNIWVGRRRELIALAHAAKETLVTVERVVEGSFFDREETVAGTLPALYVSAVAVAQKGAWPLGLDDEYETDAEAMRAYAAGALFAEAEAAA